MNTWWFSVLVIFFVWLNTGYGASIGQEVCNCQPNIITTPKISVPTASGYRFLFTKTPCTQQFSPIQNPCSCANTQVTPATVARVELDLTATTSAPECGSSNVHVVPRPFGERGSAFNPTSGCDTVSASSGYPVVQEPPGPNGIDEPEATGDPCTGAQAPAAVDPVSLMLAQAEANRCQGGIREDRLAFGPVAVPKDAFPSPTAAPDVDEEGLYSLDKAIVELKTCKRYGQNTKGSSPDTDALLALEEDLQDTDDANAGPKVNLPSYADVGYQTEVLSCAPLIGGVPVPPATYPKPEVIYQSSCATSPSSSQCSCGKCLYGAMCPGGKCTCGKCKSY